jgi:hypothetical protein
VGQCEFLSKRTDSCGKIYTSITDTSWPEPFYCVSVGLDFWLPTPLLAGSRLGEVCAAAHFCNDLRRHCMFTLKIERREAIEIPAEMLSPGYGPYGSASLSQPKGTTFTFLGEHGVPHFGNRYQFLQGAERFPRNTKIRGELIFSNTGIELLRALKEVMDYDLPDPRDPAKNLPAEAQIKLTLIGQGEIQRAGEEHTP